MTQAIRAVIVDDEPVARGAIRALLAGQADIAVIDECADGLVALESIRTHRPDLVFLDVQMPEMDGFAMLRQLDPSELPVVVFTTAYDQYALRAFDAHALDYLLKPFDDQRFHAAVVRATRQVRQGRLGALSAQIIGLLEDAPPAAAGHGAYLRRLLIKSSGRVTVLDVKDIDWIEAEGDYVKIHAGRARHLLRETMKGLESQLDPRLLVRIHRSTIVNIERIRELQPYFRGEFSVLLTDGTSLKLSRGFKPNLEAALGRSF